MLMANSELIHVPCLREWLKDALCSTTSDDHVLFKLTVYEEGRSILSHILKDYPSMIYDIPPQAWVQTGPNGYFPIFCLCSSTSGQKILLKIYETVPNTYKKIPMMAWITPCEGEHNTSSLHWLIGLNGRIGSALTFPLHWLIGLNGSIGSALLNVLFSEGYLQDSLLSADRLGLMVSAPTLCLNANLLGFLCVTNHGQDLLSSLLNRNPTLVLKIPKEAWLAPLQFTSEETLNIFQCLSKMKVGQLIIKQILSNPNVEPEVKEAASSSHLGTVGQGLDRAQSVATTPSFFPKVVSGKKTTGDSIQSTLKPE